MNLRKIAIFLIVALQQACVFNQPETQQDINSDADKIVERKTQHYICESIDDITNQQAPPDSLAIMDACIKDKNYLGAAKYLVLAKLYGHYDSRRVNDKTAGQAVSVLLSYYTISYSEAQISRFNSTNTEFQKDRDNWGSFCRSIQKIGKPDYYPKYMVLHGMKAFTGIEGDGLTSNFDEQKNWDELFSIVCTLS